MAKTETGHATAQHLEPTTFVYGGIGGLLGGVVFGAMMQMQMPMIVEMAIPGMYGLGPSIAAGWTLHLFHSLVFGLVYAAIVELTGLHGYATRPTYGVALGVVFGLVIWVIAASFVMPVWVGAMTPESPPVPDFNPASAMGHAVYGILLDGYCGLIIDR